MCLSGSLNPFLNCLVLVRSLIPSSIRCDRTTEPEEPLDDEPRTEPRGRGSGCRRTDLYLLDCW